uniref:Reverse transcriptase domain-containing protein n=1 Tax=Tanacetum cinerariifolium TaxID=118510 RepID=A0A6L2JA52_TANCI|nr:reverse transcriptase domain-containing protein [Tanacetum cinerariifolium]
MVHARLGMKEKGVFNSLGSKGISLSAHSSDSKYQQHQNAHRETESRYQSSQSRRTKALSDSEDSEGGTGSQDRKNKKSSIKEDDLSQPWICEETDPFIPRVRYFDLPNKTRMPSNVKTYDGSDDPEDHLKIFQAAAKVECWAMPTWCHMFNSTLAGSARVRFDDLPSKSVDSYDDLKKAFLANFLQQKKCIKDPVEIHHIKQKEGESIEDFVQRFKTESMHVKGPPECMRISIFMHEIIIPELIKRLHDKNKKSMDEMMRVTTAFLRGEVVASNQQMSERRRDRFTLLTITPKKFLALDIGKFKTSPPMTTLVEKRNNIKFYDFHKEVGHSTDECMHLKRQIEELVNAEKLPYVIKELKQGNEKDQPKAAKKGETSEKDKALAILMVRPWKRVAKQRITQSFSPNLEISFPPLEEEDGTEGPMIIEA